MTRLVYLPVLATLLAATIGAPPAQAAGVGAMCSMVAANDPTGIVIQDPNLYTGTLVGAYADPTATAVTVICWVQVNLPVAQAVPPIPSAVMSGSGVVVAATSPASPFIAFNAGITDVVFVCTRIEVTGPAGSYSVGSDPCAQANSVVAVNTARLLVV